MKNLMIIITIITALFFTGCALNHSSNYTADGKIKNRILLDAAMSGSMNGHY